MDVLGKMIKYARQERHLTQEEPGKPVGVQKSQISKLESSANAHGGLILFGKTI